MCGIPLANKETSFLWWHMIEIPTWAVRLPPQHCISRHTGAWGWVAWTFLSTHSSIPFLFTMSSTPVFSIWLLARLVFTTGSSTILSAVRGSFVCHHPVSLGNVLWKSPLWRLFKGGDANKEQRWRVASLKSRGYLHHPSDSCQIQNYVPNFLNASC